MFFHIHVCGIICVKKMYINGACIFPSELSARGDKRKNLFIITGRGSHSRGGVARIRPAVIRWLKQKGYK